MQTPKIGFCAKRCVLNDLCVGRMRGAKIEDNYYQSNRQVSSEAVRGATINKKTLTPMAYISGNIPTSECSEEGSCVSQMTE